MYFYSKEHHSAIYDGHSTHVDLKVIELAISENVTILKLPPHSSHILQPLDVSGMKPMKDRWEEALVKWQRLHIGAKLPKSEFARIITEIWDVMNPVILANGFNKTGIYPLNRHVIPKEKFDPLTWSRWEQYVQSQTYEQDNYVEDVSEAIRAPFEKLVDIPLKNVPTLVRLALKTLNSQPDHKSLTYCKDSKQTENKIQNKENMISYERQQQNNSIQYHEQNNRTKKNEINKILRVKKETSTEIRTYEKSKKIQNDTAITELSNKTEITLEKEKQKRIMYPKTVEDPRTYKLPLPSPKRKKTNSNNIQIVGNELIQAANTTNQINEDNFNVSFEELLLNSIARNDPPKNKKNACDKGERKY
ncbi:unnamed protein product [Parnassius apollo]|uniref:(apollo) hypothetical protein n=1 Tax=Parnassius apollo TaxID=110799 RepID=A0A8S3WB37_PARAO|nr:unnamed protein product [Parnassius apollo]